MAFHMDLLLVQQDLDARMDLRAMLSSHVPVIGRDHFHLIVLGYLVIRNRGHSGSRYMGMG